MPTNPLQIHEQKQPQQIFEKVAQEVTSSRLPWYRSRKLAYVLLGIYTIQLTLFGLLAWWVHYHPILAIDVLITREFQENHTPWLSFIMIAVSYIGSVPILALILLLLSGAILWAVHLRLEALMLVAVTLTSSLLNTLIKFLVERPRPTSKLVEVFQAAGGQSFPSGHVMEYLAYFGFLFSLGIILFSRKHWWNYALLIIPALFVVLVGPSRIYLGDHWASDVLGGYLFGGVWLGIAIWVYLKLKERGILTPELSHHKRKKTPLFHRQ